MNHPTRLLCKQGRVSRQGNPRPCPITSDERLSSLLFSAAPLFLFVEVRQPRRGILFNPATIDRCREDADRGSWTNSGFPLDRVSAWNRGGRRRCGRKRGKKLRSGVIGRYNIFLKRNWWDFGVILGWLCSMFDVVGWEETPFGGRPTKKLFGFSMWFCSMFDDWSKVVQAKKSVV